MGDAIHQSENWGPHLPKFTKVQRGNPIHHSAKGGSPFTKRQRGDPHFPKGKGGIPIYQRAKGGNPIHKRAKGGPHSPNLTKEERGNPIHQKAKGDSIYQNSPKCIGNFGEWCPPFTLWWILVNVVPPFRFGEFCWMGSPFTLWWIWWMGSPFALWWMGSLLYAFVNFGE